MLGSISELSEGLVVEACNDIKLAGQHIRIGFFLPEHIMSNKPNDNLRSYSFSVERKINKLEPKEVFDRFLHGFATKKFPIASDWTEPILGIFSEIGTEAGYEAGTGVAWH